MKLPHDTDDMNPDGIANLLVETSDDLFNEYKSRPDLEGASITFATTAGSEASVIGGDIGIHVVNHRTYHRGQIMAALRDVDRCRASHAGR